MCWPKLLTMDYRWNDIGFEQVEYTFDMAAATETHTTMVTPGAFAG